MNAHKITSNKNITDFIFGGNATFTIKNSESGNRFTFKMRKPKGADNVYFVSVFNGTDNDSHYRFIGTIFTNPNTFLNQTKFHYSKKSKIDENAQSVKVFKWFFERAKWDKIPNLIEFWHSGRCGCCGRKLTVPESIETGIGPVCAGRSIPVCRQNISLSMWSR